LKTAKLVHGDKLVDVLLANPTALKVFSTEHAFKIASAFTAPSYPADVAKRLGLSKQTVAYHVERMVKTGFLTPVGRKGVKGGMARLYMVRSSGLAFVLRGARWRKTTAQTYMPEKLRSFLKPYVSGNRLDGIVVVGSPHPHGPFLSVAADGHYGFQLGLFLGRYVEMPSDFMVRLDVDVKSEKLFTANMILLGGPGTNIITAMVNNSLSIKFPEHNYWAGVLTPRQTYTSEFVGIVAKTPNPFNPQKTVITLAGPRAAGTKAAVVALTQKWEELLSEYDGREKWAAVVQGLDLDGDGKIDSVEVLETA
jgi:hypothetical protein